MKVTRKFSPKGCWCCGVTHGDVDIEDVDGVMWCLSCLIGEHPEWEVGYDVFDIVAKCGSGKCGRVLSMYRLKRFELAELLTTDDWKKCDVCGEDAMDLEVCPVYPHTVAQESRMGKRKVTGYLEPEKKKPEPIPVKELRDGEVGGVQEVSETG